MCTKKSFWWNFFILCSLLVSWKKLPGGELSLPVAKVVAETNIIEGSLKFSVKISISFKERVKRNPVIKFFISYQDIGVFIPSTLL